MGFLCLSSFFFCFFALLCVLSSFAIILKRKRELVALRLLFYRCVVTVLNVLRLFLTVPWVGLQCVIVVFPDHSILFFDYFSCNSRVLYPFYFYVNNIIGAIKLEENLQTQYLPRH